MHDRSTGTAENAQHDITDLDAPSLQLLEESREEAPPAIEMAAPGRPYTKWQDSATFGTLIPEGYQLSSSTPDYPWICPIRSCRKVFTKINGLGGHFVRQHRGEVLHDNQDGTLSERGRYASLRDADRSSGSKPKPAIIISRGPLDPYEPPVPPPSFPDSNGEPKTACVGRNEDHATTTTNTGVITTVKQASKDQSQTIWDLLQPYLTNHKGVDIPVEGYVPGLLQLPQIRSLDWNEGRLKSHPFVDTKPRDISALIMQITGDPAPKPCSKCATGRGPFKSCIMLSSKAPIGPLTHIFACANCFYHFGQTYCSHKVWGEKRSKQIVAARKAGTNFVEPPLTTETDTIAVTDEDIKMGDDDAGLALNEGEVSHSIGGSSLGNEQVKIPAGLEFAEPGRRYDMWPDDNGALTRLVDVLLPAGYQLDNSDPLRPWACPVDVCMRRTFLRLQDFSIHFQRFHHGQCLNDNGNGTFTVVGSYHDKKVGIGFGGKVMVHAPPIVVSKTNKGQPARTASQVQQQKAGTERKPPAKQSATAPQDAFIEANAAVPLSGNAKELWEMIQPMLPHATEIPRVKAFRDLLNLPVRRPLPVEQIRVRENRDIAAIVIQLTGDNPQYLGSSVCEKCQKGGGLWDECIIISRDASSNSKEQYFSCANCLVGGGQCRCTLRFWIRERNRTGMELFSDEDGILNETVELALARAPLREEKEVRKRVKAAMRREEEAAERALKRPRSEISRSSSSDGYSLRSTPSSSLISKGTFSTEPSKTLEMEDWEIAPGRIPFKSSEGIYNAALSSPFLTSTIQSTAIFPGVSNRVQTLSPGTGMKLEADKTKARQFWVASGKVRVKLSSGARDAGAAAGDDYQQEEFSVGPGGCVIVKPGIECEVRNGVYMDASLFFTEFCKELFEE
ncbi:hypothetical protein QBC43DRAFT_218608 [Cladorrhinum sp. PSN259]|nr:hypothetical protein QBC43DRAFT_218608 [Cladorrhinum sp. PSN259]